MAALPVAARLYLPEAWAGDPERRDAAGVPLDVTFQTKPSIALELIGRALAGGVPPGMVLADEVYGSTAEFRRGVAGLGLDYALAVRSTTLVSPPMLRASGAPVAQSGRSLSVRALAARLPRSAWRWITWREGGGPDLTGRFATARVDVEHEGERTLLVEWPVGDSDPVGYWLVTLPRHTPLEAVVAAAKDRWWIEQGYRDLKQEVGLGDYEGRGWRGFHHHVTLTLAAYGFLVMRRCQTFRPAGGRAGALSFPGVEDPANPPIRTERHAPFSIPTTRRRLTVGIARRPPYGGSGVQYFIGDWDGKTFTAENFPGHGRRSGRRLRRLRRHGLRSRDGPPPAPRSVPVRRRATCPDSNTWCSTRARGWSTASGTRTPRPGR